MLAYYSSVRPVAPHSRGRAGRGDGGGFSRVARPLLRLRAAVRGLARRVDCRTALGRVVYRAARCVHLGAAACRAPLRVTNCNRCKYLYYVAFQIAFSQDTLTFCTPRTAHSHAHSTMHTRPDRASGAE